MSVAVDISSTVDTLDVLQCRKPLAKCTLYYQTIKVTCRQHTQNKYHVTTSIPVYRSKLTVDLKAVKKIFF